MDPSPQSTPGPLWTPSPDRIGASAIDRFRREVAPDRADTVDLWRWTVDEPAAFWRALWTWCDVIGDPGTRDRLDGADMRATTFLPDATLNVAANLLADRPGAGPDSPALITTGETGHRSVLSRAELRADVAAVAAQFRSVGVGPGDRVAAWMPNLAETVVAFLAASAVGAVFTSTSADFGVDGVVDRFGQIEPVVLVAADGYHYGGRSFDCMDRLSTIVERLPTVRSVLVVSNLDPDPAIAPDLAARGGESWTEVLHRHRGAEPRYESLPTDHPLYILYSSGTTGRPKCIVHRAGGVLLKHLSEQRLHCDIGPGDVVLYFTTCGWMMWNWLVSCLATGAAIVLYDGSPAHPSPASLFDVAAELDVSLLGLSAKYIDTVMKVGDRPSERHRYPGLRTICSTGSPLSAEGFAWIYEAVSADAHLASIAGGTDLCGCLVLGDPTRPVHAGEIQGPALGVAVDVFDGAGRSVPVGEKGELVVTAPFPSMPLRFWGDEDGSRYLAAYFDRFDGVWAHGDYASSTVNGGLVIHGRSDATLNASGVRIGTAEIYRVVEQFDEIGEAVAIGQEWRGDSRIVLFVRLAEGATLDGELVTAIKTELRNRCSPRHVPAVILDVADIPRTRSGKITELAVRDVVHGRTVANTEALANPEALRHFADRQELIDS